MRTRFILMQPSHAGNVGAVARAMKVMGFDDLVLVAPRWPDVLTRPEALERASGATDVLARARVVATLEQALPGIEHLCATAMTPRDFGPPTRAPRVHFDLLLNQEHSKARALGPEGDLAPETVRATAAATKPAPPPAGIGFVFGCERYGMANADVYRCHVALSIPTHPAYGSLNLAAAVQLIAYDWRQALLARFGDAQGFAPPAPAAAPRADAAQVAGLLAHWRRALEAIGFLDPATPKKLLPRLTQLAYRARLRPDEVHILRGIAKAVLEHAPRRPPSP